MKFLAPQPPEAPDVLTALTDVTASRTAMMDQMKQTVLTLNAELIRFVFQSPIIMLFLPLGQ